MNDAVDPLILELLNWVASRPRTYEETMEAWRTTCPRHSVWEDACINGLIEIVARGDTLNHSAVTLTERGRAVLCGKSPSLSS